MTNMLKDGKVEWVECTAEESREISEKVFELTLFIMTSFPSLEDNELISSFSNFRPLISSETNSTVLFSKVKFNKNLLNQEFINANMYDSNPPGSLEDLRYILVNSVIHQDDYIVVEDLCQIIFNICKIMLDETQSMDSFINPGEDGNWFTFYPFETVLKPINV